MNASEAPAPMESQFLARCSEYATLASDYCPSQLRSIAALSLEKASALSQPYGPLVADRVANHADKLQALDTYLCAKADVVEMRGRQLKEVVEGTSTMIQTNVKAQTSRIRDAVQSVEHQLGAFESTVAPVIDHGLDFVESAVDTFLPTAGAPAEGTEGAVQANVDAVQALPDPADDTAPTRVLGTETAKVVAKIRAVSSKTKTRACEKALDQIKFAAARGSEAIERLSPYTVDLIAYSKQLARSGTDGADAMPSPTTAGAVAARVQATRAAVAAKVNELDSTVAAKLDAVRTTTEAGRARVAAALESYRARAVALGAELAAMSNAERLAATSKLRAELFVYVSAMVKHAVAVADPYAGELKVFLNKLRDFGFAESLDVLSWRSSFAPVGGGLDEADDEPKAGPGADGTTEVEAGAADDEPAGEAEPSAAAAMAAAATPELVDIDDVQSPAEKKQQQKQELRERVNWLVGEEPLSSEADAE